MKKVTIKGLVITRAIHDRMVQDIEFATGVLALKKLPSTIIVGSSFFSATAK